MSEHFPSKFESREANVDGDKLHHTTGGRGAPLIPLHGLVATDVTAVVLKDAGHWILEEQPKETTGALLKFL